MGGFGVVMGAIIAAAGWLVRHETAEDGVGEEFRQDSFSFQFGALGDEVTFQFREAFRDLLACILTDDFEDGVELLRGKDFIQ
jgi:hypothetical protein